MFANLVFLLVLLVGLILDVIVAVMILKEEEILGQAVYAKKNTLILELIVVHVLLHV